MPERTPPFSKRHGYAGAAAPITVREDAPPTLREAVIAIAQEEGELSLQVLRTVVCRALRVRPDTQGNWSPANVLEEVHDLLANCEWWLVYDVIEAIAKQVREADLHDVHNMIGEGFRRSNAFTQAINEYFLQHGIGWQLEDDAIVTRGEEETEPIRRRAEDLLDQRDAKTARNELNEAIADLSRRPSPDATGAIQHAAAALECVAREVADMRNATLGDIAKRTDLFPPPMDVAVSKLYGFASDNARHLREGAEVDSSVAQLVVDLAASLIAYLLADPGH